MAAALISTPQSPGDGTNWEAFKLLRAHLLAWPRFHLSGQRVMHRLESTIIFHNMQSLKDQFDNNKFSWKEVLQKMDLKIDLG